MLDGQNLKKGPVYGHDELVQSNSQKATFLPCLFMFNPMNN